MSVVTETVFETSTTVINGPDLTTLTTVTERYYLTIAATYGQTVTISTPSSESLAIPTSKYTPSSVIPTTSTLTITELDIYLQNQNGDIFSTWTVPTSAGPSSPVKTITSEGLVMVVDKREEGWNTWSDSQKGGLIAGVVLVAVLLIAFCICWNRRPTYWMTNNWGWGWGWGWRGNRPANPQSVVPVVNVPGPLDARLATPYGYGQPSYSYGYGLRGGGPEGGTHRVGFWRSFTNRDGGANHESNRSNVAPAFETKTV